jgi:hypothetical protein
MSWQKLLADRKVKQHATSISELTQLRAIVERDISDSQIIAVSVDRRFACLYSAALQLTHMVVACCGYRVSAATGHHKTSFDSLELALGTPAKAYAIYFDVCRRKRNLAEYDRSAVASETEVQELLKQVSEFQMLVEDWISKSHPSFRK